MKEMIENQDSLYLTDESGNLCYRILPPPGTGVSLLLGPLPDTSPIPRVNGRVVGRATADEITLYPEQFGSRADDVFDIHGKLHSLNFPASGGDRAIYESATGLYVHEGGKSYSIARGKEITYSGFNGSGVFVLMNPITYFVAREVRRCRGRMIAQSKGGEITIYPMQFGNLGRAFFLKLRLM